MGGVNKGAARPRLFASAPRLPAEDEGVNAFMVAMARRLVISLHIAAGAAFGVAQAASPLQTEDADALDKGQCELEASYLRLSHGASETGAGLQCGLVPRLQAGFAFSEAHEGDERSRSAQVGGKLRLGGADDGLRWAVAAVVGADQADGHWRTASGRVSLIATLPAGPGHVHLNVGRYRDIPSQLLATTWGAAYEWNPLPVGTTAWAPMVELFGTRDMGSTLSLGLRGTLIEDKLYLNLAFGQERREPHTRLTTVGLRWAF